MDEREVNFDLPCCKLKCCRVLCEENPFCVSFGKIGLQYFHENRGVIMKVAAVLNVIALVLSIIPVVSTSLKTDDIKNTAWTYGESDDFKLWIGLNKVVYESDMGDGNFRWTSTECSDFEAVSSNFCDECKDSCLGAVSMVITNLITSLPNVSGSLSRSTIKGDRNCEKTKSVIMGTIGTISTLLALSLYVDVCARELPNTIMSQSVDYELGPGFVCLLVATLLRPIDVVLNLLTPVPSRDPDDTDNIKQPATDSSGSPRIDMRKSLLVD